MSDNKEWLQSSIVTIICFHTKVLDFQRKKRQCQDPSFIQHNLHGPDEQLLNIRWQLKRVTVRHVSSPFTLTGHCSSLLIFVDITAVLSPAKALG